MFSHKSNAGTLRTLVISRSRNNKHALINIRMCQNVSNLYRKIIQDFYHEMNKAVRNVRWYLRGHNGKKLIQMKMAARSCSASSNYKDEFLILPSITPKNVKNAHVTRLVCPSVISPWKNKPGMKHQIIWNYRLIEPLSNANTRMRVWVLATKVLSC